MKKQLTLIYVKQTGGALAVITRETPVPAPPGDLTDDQREELESLEVAALVGTTLPVRHISTASATAGVNFDVTADNLGAFTADFDAAVLADPRSFFVQAAEKQVKPLSSGTVTVAVTSTTATVTLPSNVTVKTFLWVLIQATGSATPPSQVVSGSIDPNDPVKNLKTFTLRPLSTGGEFAALALVTGFPPAVLKQIV